MLIRSEAQENTISAFKCVVYFMVQCVINYYNAEVLLHIYLTAL